MAMQLADHFFFWAGALAGLIVLLIALAYYFSAPVRERRKRRRNYGPVISNARRPVVTLQVNTKKT
jgi:hypothetical protein